MATVTRRTSPCPLLLLLLPYMSLLQQVEDFARQVKAHAQKNSRAGFEKREKRRQMRALQEAIDKKDTDAVREILVDDFDVDFQYRSQTALQLAVREGCGDITKLLIDKGADVNLTDAEMNNVLHLACWRGYNDVAKILVQNSANIDERNSDGLSAVHLSVEQGHTDILQILLTAGGDPDVANLTGETPLHTATRLHDPNTTWLLLLAGGNVDSRDEHRRTPLMVAAELGFIDIASMLIDSGADLNCQDWTGSSALFEAVHNGHLAVVQELVKAGADVNLPTTKGISPLLGAIQGNHTEIAMFLIRSGCDVDHMDRLNQAPIHAAVRKVCLYFNEETEGVMTLIRGLVGAGCDVNVGDQHGERPLHQAASGGNIELTEYLLSQKPDLTVTTVSGDTILHAGAHGNKPEMVDILIKAGCDLNGQNQAGEHPLMTAIVHQAKIEIIRLLVMAGSNLNVKDKAGADTVLHKAILQRYSEASMLLIDSGSDVNALNRKRQTPLYTACEKNDEATARRILRDPKFSRKLFSIASLPQPLFAAVTNNHVDLVDTLIKCGCDINMVTSSGLSPVLLAIQENCLNIVRLLLKYNCDLEAHAKVTRLLKCCLLHEDTHPHFDLEPLFLALTHKSVDLLQLIIRCYWKIPVETITLLDTVFCSTPDLNTHYSADLKATIQEVFRVAVKMPRSLQETCRAVIRETLGPCPVGKVEQLPLAKKLKDYVLMDEYFGDLQATIRREKDAHPTDFQSYHSPAGVELDAESASSEELT